MANNNNTNFQEAEPVAQEWWNRIVLTPINLVDNVKGDSLAARTDYLREQPNFGNETEFNPKWDDSHNNNARVGDGFAFVQNGQDVMELFEVRGIIQSEDRPDYWDIPEHRRRRILILSKKIDQVSFAEYKRHVNYSDNYNIQGTIRSRWW